MNPVYLEKHKFSLSEKEYHDLNKVKFDFLLFYYQVLARKSILSIKEKTYLIRYAVKGIPMELRGRVTHSHIY
jgi:Na+/citrate or Na+/malate symporter